MIHFHQLPWYQREDGDPPPPPHETIAFKPHQCLAIGMPAGNEHLENAHVLVGIIDAGIAAHPNIDLHVVYREQYSDCAFEPKLHGTHVAGIIGGNDCTVGIAPGVRLANYCVFDDSGYAFSDRVARAIRRAISDGCDVLNVSLGSARFNRIICNAVREALACGVFVVAPAGNERDNDETQNDETDNPATSIPGLISVGAVFIDKETGQLRPSSFTKSNAHVSCVALGENIHRITACR